MWNSSIWLLRKVGVIEGISYIILLFIAMPLKYFADMPLFVTVFGMAHGILFILFGFILLFVWVKHRWTFLSVLWAFIASLIPFGTFILDSRLAKQS